MSEGFEETANGHQDHEVLAESTAQVGEMEQDTECATETGATGVLDFSSVFPVCVARKAFNCQQVYMSMIDPQVGHR